MKAMLKLMSVAALLCLGNAVQADEFLDFNNNLMPSGWDMFLTSGSRARNIGISGGMLQIGQEDTYGGIFKKLDMNNVSQLKVEYDGSLSSTIYGMGTSVFLMNSVVNTKLSYGTFNINTPTTGSLQVAASSPFAGGGRPYASINYNEVGGGSDFWRSASGSLGWGMFHFTDTFKDGVVTQAVSATSTINIFGTTYQSGQQILSKELALNDFTLSSMPYVGLWGVATRDAVALIDNVRITTIVVPVFKTVV